MRVKYFIHGLWLAAFIAAVAGCGKSGELPSKQYSTCLVLLNVAGAGCEEFKNNRGAWPNSLDDLISMRSDITRKDGWGHDLVFTPYDAAKGYGEIISYGADGKPGGAGEDTDLVIRFPVKANADWNRQVAMSVKVPKEMQGNSAWYDFYLR